ncbi:hypothetical protein [Arthrobacter sp. NicSoilC12]|uniref:hypothetical protein n=1 Tax=Arthrobacter sp. NicSoilC12 TaxID=2831001 RepID=UPI001CC7B2B1|nr:hypothetical protein [Arthrobacter sp. NicSoilC12]
MTAFLGLVALLVIPIAAVADDSEVSWSTSGLGVWRYDAGAGVWVDAPGAVAEDPNIYKFEYLCLDATKNNFDVDCLAGAVRCDQGRDGRPVRWYTSLRVFDPPIWSTIRPDRCVYLEKPVDVLGQIAAQIQTKFQQLPINAGRSVMQPSPHTLRGAETNFYAEAIEQTFGVDMLGQSVAIVAKPVQYAWSYGDGTSLGPQAVAGGPLPQDRWGEKTLTSHVYTQTGDFPVVLTTHFQGTYSVNGGPPLPIPGQGQFSSPPQTVSVWRTITRNYADTCLQNPQGQGCPGVAPPPP